MVYGKTISMKKLSTYLFLVLFSFSTPSFADDIRDFQIGGISVGDSLLDYFSEEEINKQKKTFYPSKKFYVMYLPYVFDLGSYEDIDVSIKNNDQKYTIYSIGGTIFFQNNINECYKKKDEIEKELSEIFKDVARKDDVGNFTMNADISGKSIATTVNFVFDSGDFISIQCIDWSKKMNLPDNLGVSIVTNEYNEFTLNEVYK